MGEPARATPLRPALIVLAVTLVGFNLRTAVAAVPPILPELGLTDLQGALLTSLPVLLFGVLAPPTAMLRTWLGEERGIALLLVVLLLTIAARPLGGVGALFAGTLAACAAIAALNVLLPSFIGRSFRGRAGWLTGIYTMALSVGAALASAVAVPVRDAAGGSNAVALAMWALPVAVAIAAWLPVLRERAPAPRTGAPLPSVWRSPHAWTVGLFLGFGSLVYFAPLSYMALIYRDNGLAPDVAGGLVGLMSLIGIASSLAAPVLADRMGDARPAVTWSVLASVGGVAGLLLAPAALAILSAVLLGIGQGAALALGLFLVIDQEDPERVVGTSAMVHAVAYTIAATGPFAMGMLHTLSDGWTVPLVALLAMAGAQLLAGIAATRPPAPRLAPA